MGGSASGLAAGDALQEPALAEVRQQPRQPRRPGRPEALLGEPDELDEAVGAVEQLNSDASLSESRRNVPLARSRSTQRRRPSDASSFFSA